MDEITDKAAWEFMQLYEEKTHLSFKKQESFSKIIDDKNNILIPVRKLLKRLVDAGVYVSHSAMHDNTVLNKNYAPQALEVWEGESSPSWQPGSSLYIDHPASIEIAVPNHRNSKDSGIIILACSTEHPDKYLLEGPFSDVEQACMALVKFLSGSTVRIERPELLKNN